MLGVFHVVIKMKMLQLALRARGVALCALGRGRLPRLAVSVRPWVGEELDEPEPGMLFVRVKGKTHPLHVFLPSPMEALQQGDGADAKAWRMLWASAVDESVVSLALESARDTNLAERFTMLREEKQKTRALLLAKSASALPRDSKEAEEATAPR